MLLPTSSKAGRSPCSTTGDQCHVFCTASSLVGVGSWRVTGGACRGNRWWAEGNQQRLQGNGASRGTDGGRREVVSVSPSADASAVMGDEAQKRGRGGGGLGWTLPTTKTRQTHGRKCWVPRERRKRGGGGGAKVRSSFHRSFGGGGEGATQLTHTAEAGRTPDVVRASEAEPRSQPLKAASVAAVGDDAGTTAGSGPGHTPNDGGGAGPISDPGTRLQRPRGHTRSCKYCHQ